MKATLITKLWWYVTASLIDSSAADDLYKKTFGPLKHLQRWHSLLQRDQLRHTHQTIHVTSQRQTAATQWRTTAIVFLPEIAAQATRLAALGSIMLATKHGAP
jgi:hypothetical protein